jgi:hypothetical protein
MGSNKISMAKTITREAKRKSQSKARRSIACRNQKKEKANPSLGNYFIHGPSNVAFM